MDSLQASRINGGNSAAGRRTSDLYPTPPEVTVALMEFLSLPDRTMIWEPAAGEGDMVKAIQNCGYEHVSGTDIFTGLDFLDAADSLEWHASFDWIITNPPFKLAEQFIRKAASLRRPFAFLLKSQYWHAAIRVELFGLFIEWDLDEGFVWQSLAGINAGEIGKTVFLTREEAEKALKEVEQK